MPGIREAAEELDRNTDRLEELRRNFSKIDGISTGASVRESFLSKDIESVDPSKVAGVDGGLLKKSYSTGDVVVTRAVAAIFSYGEDASVDYLPEKAPEPDFHVFEPEGAESIEKNAELERSRAETRIAREALEKADTVLMDGSVVPAYVDEEGIESYSKLFEKAEKGSLAGVVEDSYGFKLSSILEEKLGLEIGKLRDTLIMDCILEAGERSFVRKYSASPVEHPVLQELEDRHANRLYTFYVKLSSRDLPLRIDYYGEESDASDIAGKLLKLKSSRSYTVPAPVVEADKRAKIPQEQLKRLEKRFSPEARRRERRPF